MTKSVPDRPARARTRAGRLAAWDAWLRRELAGARATVRVADVGFGESPATVGELRATLIEAALGVDVLGLERDVARVETARREAPGLRFELGGFEVLARLGPFDVVRVANVLRSYRAEEVPAVHAVLSAALAPGGLALEGSSDTEGHVSTWYALRPGPVRERLVFHTDFARGFSPKLFRDWLPSDYRRNLAPESELARFLTAWWEAWEQGRGTRRTSTSSVRTEVDSERETGSARTEDPTGPAHSELVSIFTATAERLAVTQPVTIHLDAHGGFLEWRPPGGVPLPTRR